MKAGIVTLEARPIDGGIAIHLEAGQTGKKKDGSYGEYSLEEIQKIRVYSSSQLQHWPLEESTDDDGESDDEAAAAAATAAAAKDAEGRETTIKSKRRGLTRGRSSLGLPSSNDETKLEEVARKLDLLNAQLKRLFHARFGAFFWTACQISFHAFSKTATFTPDNSNTFCIYVGDKKSPANSISCVPSDQLLPDYMVVGFGDDVGRMRVFKRCPSKRIHWSLS